MTKIFRKKIDEAPPVDNALPRWGWPELFLVIQFLSTALLFIPGAQSVRFIIRTLPYAASVGLFCLYLMQRKSRPFGLTDENSGAATDAKPGGKAFRKKKANQRTYHPALPWAYAILGLLVLQMFNPGTHMRAGIAQIGFQICIMSPLIWGMFWVRSVPHLRRLVWLTLACNAASVVAGYLQIYYPDQFMPKEFTTLDPEIVDRLKIVLADGTETVTRIDRYPWGGICGCDDSGFPRDSLVFVSEDKPPVEGILPGVECGWNVRPVHYADAVSGHVDDLGCSCSLLSSLATGAEIAVTGNRWRVRVHVGRSFCACHLGWR